MRNAINNIFIITNQTGHKLYFAIAKTSNDTSILIYVGEAEAQIKKLFPDFYHDFLGDGKRMKIESVAGTIDIRSVATNLDIVGRLINYHPNPTGQVLQEAVLNLRKDTLTPKNLN